MSFEALGIKVTSFIAGIMGGLAALTREAKVSPLRAILLLFTGGTLAGYSNQAIEYYFQIHSVFGGIISWVVGLTAMYWVDIVLHIMNTIRKKPAILLSIPELLATIKNGSISTGDKLPDGDNGNRNSPPGTSD